eukprot:UN25640
MKHNCSKLILRGFCTCRNGISFYADNLIWKNQILVPVFAPQATLKTQHETFRAFLNLHLFFMQLCRPRTICSAWSWVFVARPAAVDVALFPKYISSKISCTLYVMVADEKSSKGS